MPRPLSELRSLHPRFVYQGYAYHLTEQGLEATFSYLIEPGFTFTHRLVFFQVTEASLANLSVPQLENYLFHIGLVEMLSYWKLSCAQEINIQAGYLTSEQIAWWHDLLIKGMGEFFFVNQIDFTAPDFVKLTVAPSLTSTSSTSPLTDSPTSSPHILIPVGGGKDSALTIELLTQALPKEQLACLQINPTLAAQELCTASGLPTYRISRQIDPQLLQLNQAGYLNGHVPFSASVAFITTLGAQLWGFTYIPVSNERSSNEGSVWFHGHYVNHQYSKTYEFESGFQKYVAQYLQKPPFYFSFMRPLYELQIGQLFAQAGLRHQQVLKMFRSCNRGKNTNAWCGECSKCLFTYATLYPYLPHELMVTIYGQNLFAKSELWPIAAELLGYAQKKPLECVGTHEETIVAFWLSAQKLKQAHQPVPALLAHALQEITQRETGLPLRAKQVMTSWNKEHSLPTLFEDVLKKFQPNVWQTLADSNSQVVVFGLGREGISTLRFLRQLYPDKTYLLVDDRRFDQLSPEVKQLVTEDAAHFKFHGTGDVTPIASPHLPTVIVKSAGIPYSHPLLQAALLHPHFQITTNTQLFFEVLNDQKLLQVFKLDSRRLTTIGITGTKGKSTTSALVHQILKTGRIPVVLGGNIGTPPLELISELMDLAAHLPHASELVIVLELSCHQLSDLSHSPNVAIVQDITPEHLDYYADFNEYVTAKSQITRYQTPDDTVIFNPEFAQPTKLAQLSPAHPLTFGRHNEQNVCYVQNDAFYYHQEKIIEVDQLPLKGEFNWQNVMPALVVGKHFGLSTTQIAEALTSFQPLDHRLQLVATINGVEFYNDSLSTTPIATIGALTSFKHRGIVLIAGGYERNLDYSELAQTLAGYDLKALLLFMPTGQRIWQAVSQYLPELPHHFVENMSEAVDLASKYTQPNTVVLLSPASPSFGVFKDYRDRGEQFKAAALQLK